MALSSAHTKHFLEDLHENIAVMRHPDHLGGEMTLFWSHQWAAADLFPSGHYSESKLTLNLDISARKWLL